MKHKANQFDLPAQAEVFNLAGERVKMPEEKEPAKMDNTPELFTVEAKDRTARRYYTALEQWNEIARAAAQQAKETP